MLTPQREAILKLLVAMAWADGKVDEEELEVVEALLSAFEAGADEAEGLRAWARSRRSLEEVDVTSLTVSDLELALQHAVLLTFIDGEQSPEEVALLDRVMARLGLSREAAAPILESATRWARGLLPELEK
jgi:DnaJ-domain-containing protein 1